MQKEICKYKFIGRNGHLDHRVIRTSEYEMQMPN